MLLKGWLILQPNSKECATIVFMHENAGNIGLRMDYFQILHGLKYNIMSVAYRGYSESVGIPTEAGLKLDGIAMCECIRE